MRPVNRSSSLALAITLCAMQGCSIPTRVATVVPPGTEANDRALGCGPVPEIEPYVYRIPSFQAAEMKYQDRHQVPFRFSNPLNPAPPGKLSIAWTGTYTAESRTRIDSSSSLKGYTTTARGIAYGEQSSQVVAKLGTSFGAWLKFDSVVPNNSTRYRYVWRLPATGLVNPNTGVRHFSDAGQATCSVGDQCLRGWLFSEAWELVPGTWTLEIWQGDDFVESRAFEVRLD